MNNIDKREMSGGVIAICNSKSEGAAALIFPSNKKERFLIISSPPPLWLLERNLWEIQIGESGVYCLYFLFFSKSGGRAALCINGRAIAGSETETDNGVICNTAICSIRDAALPCSVTVSYNNACEGGILLAIKYRV